MKRFVLCAVITILVLTCFSFASMARTRIDSEGSAIASLGTLLELYSAYTDGDLPEKWSDILMMDGFYYDRYDRLTRPIAEGQNLTDRYSFILSKDRDTFPAGELVLVSYIPRPRIDGREGPGWRTLMYRNERGMIVSESWDEERFQAMLTETGITIPPPQPLPPEPPLPAENQQQLEPQLQSEDSKSESAAEQSAIPDDADFPAPPENQPAQPDSEQQAEETENRTLLWLAGTLLALLLIAAVLRARKRDGSQ